jgi:cytoskeletal protein RodZ
MATVDITDVRPNRNSFAEGRLNPPAELWAPPLAPNGTTAAGYVVLREDAIWPEIGGEDSFQPPEPSNLSETFGSRRKLIAGTAIIAALGVAGLTYFFLASPGAKVPAETAESSPIAVQSSSGTPVQAAVNVPEPSSPTRVESSSETPVQPAPTVPEPSRGASGVVPSPDVPASLTAEASPQVAPSAAQNPDLVFLQRPGVNIRSAPSGNAPVLGTAPRGTQFTATSREGDWVQVENTRLKGWINSQFLAPNKPQ